MRGDQSLTKDLIKSQLGKYKGSVGSCPRDLHVSFSWVRVFCLVLEPRGRLGGKVGSACEG